VKHSRKLLSLLAAAGVASLSACASSSLAGSTSTSSSTTPSSSATVPAANSVVAAAQAEIDKYTGIPPFVAPNGAFSVSSLKGKEIACVIVDETTPSLLSTLQGVQSADALVGIKTTVYNAQDAPTQMTAGVAEAVATHASAIVLIGISSQLTAKELISAKQAHIPVVMANNSEPDASAPGQGSGANIYATAAPDYTLQGKLAADAAIVATGGDAKALLFTTDGIQPAPAVLEGLQEGMAACSTCTVLDTSHVQLQDWFNGNLASLTASVLSTKHAANVILPIYVTMATFMMPAARQAGAGSVQFFSTSAPPDEAKELETFPELGGLAGMSDNEIGWLATDQAMRGMLGLAPGNPTIPTRYLTAATVKQAGDTEGGLYGNAYIAGYKKLWGLG
jgi:ribose transport system substrate-binding protein